MDPKIFISYSSKDQKVSRTICTALENRGLACWISSRNVEPGQNYQEQIVKAIRAAKIMILVFTANANNSNEIKKELALASQNNLIVIPVRIEDVTPNEAFSYEFATRQWIDLFDHWENSIARLAELIAGTIDDHPTVDRAKAGSGLTGDAAAPSFGKIAKAGAAPATAPASFMQRAGSRWAMISGLVVIVIVIVIVAAAIAYEVVTSSQQPASVSVTVPGGELPTQLKAPAQVASPARSQPAQTPTPVGLLSPERERTLKPPDRFKECENCPEMVTVPAGTFVMGSPASEPGREADEGPQQQVVIGRMFAVGRSAVTFDEWNACVAEGGCNAYRPGDYGWGGSKQPVINVSWNDAQAYVKWLSAKTGTPYRLLSEAEREYVTRGCTSTACPSTPFWFGAEIAPDRANYDWRYSYAGSAKAQPQRRTVATDASEPNPFDVLQVHGNVREWVEDCWNGSLSGIPKDGTARTTGDCTSRVIRGGSWADEPKDLRSAKRNWEMAGERRAEIGFRVARTLRN